MNISGHREKNDGFTLIELLTVMGIILVMAGITVASYFTMTKGATASSAAYHVRSALNYARQAAMLEGKKVAVLFKEVDGRPTYLSCTIEGAVEKDVGAIVDPFGSFEMEEGLEARIYNLRTGDSSDVTKVDYNADYDLVIETGGSWQDGDQYGWEVRPANRLPEGLQWASLPVNNRIVFNADGTSETGADQEVLVKDTRGGNNEVVFKITVSKSGFAEVELDP